jgi:soluble lytic murein transglycosylase-like protein
MAAGWVIVLFYGSPARADLFYLTEDRLIEGILVREDTSTVTFQLEGAGLWTLSKHSLHRVEKESEGAYWLRQAERHARRNRWDRAKTAFLNASKHEDTQAQAERRLQDIDLLEKSITPEITESAIPPVESVAKAGELEEIAEEPAPQVDPAPEVKEIPKEEPAPAPVAPVVEKPAPIEPATPVQVAKAAPAPVQVPAPSPRRSTPPVPAPVAKSPAKSPVAKNKTQIDPQLSQIIRKYSQTHGVDPLLVKAMITVESRWNTRAVSSSGAKGLMQLMPETAASLGVTDPYDPEQNIRAGVTYLGRLFKEFDHPDWQFRQAQVVAAYNAGPNKIREVGDYRRLPQSVRYTNKVMSAYRQLKDQKNRELAFLDSQLTR